MGEFDRELMRDAVTDGRIFRYRFMRLPLGLQDEVIRRLDNREWSYQDSSDYISAQGESLGPKAIETYYLALLEQRRINRNRDRLMALVHQFAGSDAVTSVSTLLGLLVSQVCERILSGELQAEISDIVKLLRSSQDILQVGKPRFRGRARVTSQLNQIPTEDVTIEAENLKKMIGSIYGIPNSEIREN